MAGNPVPPDADPRPQQASTDEPARPPRRHASAGRLYKQRDPRHPGALCGVWWLDYSIRGKRYRESAKTTVRAEAAKLLRQRLAEHASGRYAPNAERVTLAQLVDGLRTHYRLKGRRSLARVEQAMKRVVAYFGGDTRAVELTTPRLEAYAVQRQADRVRGHTIGPATVRYELACLRKAMTLAVRSGLLQHRPVFPELAAGNVRTGFFEAAELGAVLAELPAVLRPVVQFGAVTGWRKQECLGLTWDRVDFARGVVRLDPGTTKNDAGRVFPFGQHRALADVLAAARAYTDGVQKRTATIVPWVFHREGRKIKSMDAAWQAACERAGAPGMLFHDLRRTSVRALVRAGVSDLVAMQLTGHKTRTVFDRYNITSGRDLSDAVGKLDAAAPEAPAGRTVLPLKAAAGSPG